MVPPGRMRRQSCPYNLHSISRGPHSEILRIFDAVLPPDLTLKSQDGKVAGFVLIDVPELVGTILADKMMDDAQLVTPDVFRRYGLLKPQHLLSR